MKSRIQSTHLSHENVTLFANFWWKTFTSYVFRCFPVFGHDITLFLFDNQVGFNEWKKKIKHWAGRLPIINRSPELLFANPNASRVFISAKCFLQPNNELFFAVRYFNKRMPLKSVAVIALLCATNIEATFSIYNPCQIRQLQFSDLSVKFNKFCHAIPFDCYTIIINENDNNVQPERLKRVDTQKRKAKVRPQFDKIVKIG